MKIQKKKFFEGGGGWVGVRGGVGGASFRVGGGCGVWGM